MSQPRKELHFQRSQTSLGWLVGAEEIKTVVKPWIYIAVKVLDLTWAKVSSFTLQLAAAACPTTAKLVLKQGRVGGGIDKTATPFASFDVDFSVLSSLRYSQGDLCHG